VTGVVEFVEELGSEVIVHSRVEELGPSAGVVPLADSTDDDNPVVSTASNLVTKLPARMPCRPGHTLTLFIDPANIHCFDPAGPSLRKEARA